MLLGYLLIVIASILWSLSPAIISRFSRRIRPVTFTGLRASIASATLLILFLVRGAGIDSLSYVAIAVVTLSAIIGLGVGDVLYTKSIQALGGFLAVVLGYTYIFIAQAIAVFFLGELAKATLVFGSLLAFVGVVIAVQGGINRERPLNIKARGVAYAVMASVSWGVSTSLIKVALNFADELTLTLLRLSTIAIVFLPAGLLSEGVPLKGDLKLLLLIATITATLDWTLGMYIFICSIGIIGVSATAVVTALTPVLSTITTRLIAREKPLLTNITGALLTSAGIIVTAL
ncbi:MAG: DMT family transporter [Zestosphaera sp.]